VIFSFASPLSFVMSQTVTKKRKQDFAAHDQDVHSRKPKKSRTGGKKDKGKSRSTEGGEFTVVKSTLRVSIAPVFAGNPRAGVEEMLDSMVMRSVKGFVHFIGSNWKQ